MGSAVGATATGALASLARPLQRDLVAVADPDVSDHPQVDQVAAQVPYVELDRDYYKLVGEFDKRFPEGAPSLKKASSLRIDGDFTFGHGVQVVGDEGQVENRLIRALARC